MNTWYIPIFIFSGFLIYSFLKRLFIKGEIQEAFIIEDKDELFLYQFIDYYAREWTRSGTFETHRYKLRRINLTNLTSEYEKKIVFSSSKIIYDNTNIIGINNKYFFVDINASFFIIDLRTGKRIAKKKTILNKNPNIKDFEINNIIYSKTLKTIIIYDKTGDSYYLDTDTLILKRLNREIEDDEEVRDFFNLENLPLLKLQSFKEDNKGSSIQDSIHKIKAPYIPVIEQDYTDIKDKEIHHTELKDYFLHPRILSQNKNESSYGKDKTNILIVLHAKKFKQEASELMLSAVVENKETLWTRNLSELFINASFGEDNKLYSLEHKNNLILILSSGKNRYKMSLSTINKENGDIIHQPVQYINKGI